MKAERRIGRRAASAAVRRAALAAFLLGAMAGAVLVVTVSCSDQPEPAAPPAAVQELPDFLVVEKEFGTAFGYRFTIIYKGEERRLSTPDDNCWKRVSIGEMVPLDCR